MTEVWRNTVGGFEMTLSVVRDYTNATGQRRVDMAMNVQDTPAACDIYGTAVRQEIVGSAAVTASITPGLDWDDQCRLWQKALTGLQHSGIGWTDLEPYLLRQGVPFERTREFALCFLGA